MFPFEENYDVTELKSCNDQIVARMKENRFPVNKQFTLT
jgi:hypothetical protein